MADSYAKWNGNPNCTQFAMVIKAENLNLDIKLEYRFEWFFNDRYIILVVYESHRDFVEQVRIALKSQKYAGYAE